MPIHITDTGPQSIYDTYTDDNNYRRGIFTFLSGASAFVIGTQTSTSQGNSALSALVSPIIIAPGYNQSLSANAPVVFRQTWGRAATVFTMLCANVTDSASSANSLLMDLRVAGSSMFTVPAAKGTNGAIDFVFASRYQDTTDNTRLIFATKNFSLASSGVFGGRVGLSFNGGSPGSITPLNTSGAPRIILGGGGGGAFEGLWLAAVNNTSTDVFVTADAANTFVQRNGTAAQTSRLYNTFTARGVGTTNLEALETKAVAAGSFIIQSLRGSLSGTARDIEFRHGAIDTNGVITNGALIATITSTGLTLGTALAIAQGGTGGTSASTARTNLGLGTADSPTFAALTVTGHFTAATKSFLIDHPTKQGKKLQYGVVESNQHSVFVRGKTNQSIINLPEEWIGLVHEDSVTVHLTPIGKFQGLFVVSQDNATIEVGGNDSYYNYTVYGERKDVDKLQVEI